MREVTKEDIEELLKLPEIQVSITVEGKNGLVAVVKHLIRRSEIIGALDEIQKDL